MEKTILTVKCTLMEEMLGMSPGNEDLLTTHIERQFDKRGKREPESVRANALVEEPATVAGAVEKAMTVFPRDKEGGRPFLWNYQMRGAFKDWAGKLICAGWGGKDTRKPWKAYNAVMRIDACLFVLPRVILLDIPDGCDVETCDRPLRANTPRGPRVAIAKSESVPAGTTFEFDVHVLNPKYLDDVKAMLEYGEEYGGLGAWRNSGKGAFSYTFI